MKTIIWKSYNNNEILFENINVNESSKTKIDRSSKERIYETLKTSPSFITEIEPFLPLNNFLDFGNFQTSVRWKSSFDGGVSVELVSKIHHLFLITEFQILLFFLFI